MIPRASDQRRAFAVLGLGLLAACSGGDANGATRGGGSGGAGSGAFGNAPVQTPVSADSGNAATGAAGAGSAVPTAGTPSGACAEGVADTLPVTPTVWLVLDGSGSMDDDFSGETRWTALRAALMGTDGVVTALAPHVRFGMVLYSGAEEDEYGNPPAECVQLVTVQPALDNYAAIDAQLPQREPGGWTPTDRALQYVVDSLPVDNMTMLDADPSPVYVILATDGAPNDRCSDSSSGGGGRRGGGSGLQPEVAQRVIDQVGRGVQMGMQLLVISLAGGDAELQMHLEQVTQVAANGFSPFVPATRDELVSTLQQIVGGASCRIALEGMVAAGQECSGQVMLNGVALPCNDDNGFRLVDPSTVQLMGSACSDFLASQSLVDASFPCGVFTPI